MGNIKVNNSLIKDSISHPKQGDVIPHIKNILDDGYEVDIIDDMRNTIKNLNNSNDLKEHIKTL